MKDKAKEIINRVVPSSMKSDSAEVKEGVPRITNDTIAEHREEVLAGARKFMYPLTHSKHKVVLISSVLTALALIAFFTYTMLSLYRWQSSNNFIYQVSRVIPFPVARTGSKFVSYESYLFELRHYIHYYETQENVNFKDDKAKSQLDDYRRRSLDKVINDAYISKLAKQEGVSVSDSEVNAKTELLRSQNRLGNNEDVFEDVLKDFYDWTPDDYKRRLRQQMLSQKVNAKLDAETQKTASEVIAQVKAGGDFAVLAKKYSQDPATKDNGGTYTFSIKSSSRDVPPELIGPLFSLKAGETSELIDVGHGIEIIKILQTDGKEVKAAHILLNYKDINTYINDAKANQNTRLYIKKP